LTTTPAHRWTRRLGALLVMVAGTVSVLAVTLVINAFNEPPPKPPATEHASFQVERRATPKRARPRPRQRPKPQRQAPRAVAPPPSVAAAISGVDLGLTSSASFDTDQAARDLLGDGSKAADLVMTEASVDQPPRASRRVPPRFPPRARADGVEGSVTLRLLIGEAGEVQKVKVVSGQPAGVFDEAAAEAVRQWQFEPATYKGQRVKVWARQTVRFALM
jgi:protein TonB